MSETSIVAIVSIIALFIILMVVIFMSMNMAKDVRKITTRSKADDDTWKTTTTYFHPVVKVRALPAGKAYTRKEAIAFARQLMKGDR